MLNVASMWRTAREHAQPLGNLVVRRPLVFVLGMTLGSLSCGGAATDTAATIVSVSVSPSNPTLTTVGQTVTLTATVLGRLGSVSNPDVAWSSNAPAVVDVSGSGATATATARAAGSATITASSGGQTGNALITVTITVLPVSTISVSDRAVTLTVGASKQLTALAHDAGGAPLPDRPVGWSAVNPSIASVSASGLVTAIAAGTGRIVASAEGKTDTAVVTVTAGPSIAFSAPTLTFTAVPGGANPSSQTVTITNGGGGTLNNITLGTTSYSAGATGWLQATLTGNSANPSATITVQPVITGLAAGTYGASVLVIAPGASNSPDSIAVTLTVAQAPTIVLSQSAINFSIGQGGGPQSQGIFITNGGGGTLSGLTVGTITYSANATGWITTSFDNTTAAPKSTLTIQASPVGLSPGTYTATVPVASALASNSPRNVTVTLTIPAPGLTVTTLPAEIVLASSATIYGGVAQNGQPYTTWFDWGTSPTLATSAQTTTNTGPTAACPGTLTCGWGFTLVSLQSNTTYYYRIVAQNAAATSRGNILSFTTAAAAPVAPVISSLTSTLLGLNSANCAASAGGNGGSQYSFTFSYTDGNGDVSILGTPVTLNFAFQPTGTSGSSPWPVASATGNGFSGTITTQVCIAFGGATSVNYTWTLRDAAGQPSNGLPTSITKPAGANSTGAPSARPAIAP
jgi:hypothetical protein